MHSSIPIRVIPTLLLRNRGLVKGIRFKKHQYVGDPLNAVRIFNEKEVDELIFLDIVASSENRTVDLDLVQEIADECYMPFAVGGGITSIEQVRDIISRGAEKVVLNSAAVSTPKLITEVSEQFGSQAVVVAIDVKRSLLGQQRVYINNGRVSTKLDPVEHAKRVEQLGAGEILINSIDRDGTMSGYEIDLIRKVADSVNTPVIASGGAGGLDHFRDVVIHSHASAVAAGSFFVFHNKSRGVLINYPERKKIENLFR